MRFSLTLTPVADKVFAATSIACSRSISGSIPSTLSAIMSTAYFVRCPISPSSRMPGNRSRVAFFHAWLETLARFTPPNRADFGLPVSSRLMLLGGTVWRICTSMNSDSAIVVSLLVVIGNYYSLELPASVLMAKANPRPHASRTESAL